MGVKSSHELTVTDVANLSTDTLIKMKEDCNFTVYADCQGRLLQEYKVVITSSQSMYDQLQIYQLRHNHPTNIVSVLHVEIVQGQSPNSASQQLKVFTQRIPTTLETLSKMSVEMALSVIKESAAGFQNIFRQIGYFQITESVIGFNVNRQVKVWINNNWALNNYVTIIRRRGEHQNEHQMVLRLLEVVETHMEASNLYHAYTQKRKEVKEWTFKKLKEFLSRFAFEKNVRLQSSINFDSTVNVEKSKRNLSFRAKSNSPNAVKLNCSLGTNREGLKNLLATQAGLARSKDNHPLAATVSIHNSKTPHVLEFKSKPSKHYLDNHRDRRNSEFAVLNLISTDFGNRVKRHSECQSGIVSQVKRLIVNVTEHSESPAVPVQRWGLKSTKQSLSLQNVRFQLRKHLGNLDEQELRASCPAIQPYQTKNLSPSIKILQCPQLQFKGANMKKKKRPSVTINQDELSQDRPLPLPHCLSKKVPKPKTRLDNEKGKKDLSLKSSSKIFSSTSMDYNSYSIASSHIPRGNIVSPANRKKFKNNLFDQPFDDLRSTLPNYKSYNNSDSSMIGKSSNSPGKTTITLMSKSKNKELKESELISGNQCKESHPVTGEFKFFGFNSLQIKNTLTRSINIPTTKQKEMSKKKEKKPLSMLDMMIVRRNTEKAKNQELDVSVQFSETPETIHRSIAELQQECD